MSSADVDDKSSISSSPPPPAFNVIHEGLGKRTTLKAASSAANSRVGNEGNNNDASGLADFVTETPSSDNDAGDPVTKDADAVFMTKDDDESRSKVKVDDGESSGSEKPTGDHQPRVKHVCRKASVAKRQGSPAKFRSPTSEELHDEDDKRHLEGLEQASTTTMLQVSDVDAESESSVDFCRLSALPRLEKDKVVEDASHR